MSEIRTHNNFKEYKKAVSETVSQGNPLGKQRKIVTSAAPCAPFLSWLLSKADLTEGWVLFPISFYLKKKKIYIVVDKKLPSLVYLLESALIL